MIKVGYFLILVGLSVSFGKGLFMVCFLSSLRYYLGIPQILSVTLCMSKRRLKLTREICSPFPLSRVITPVAESSIRYILTDFTIKSYSGIKLGRDCTEMRFDCSSLDIPCNDDNNSIKIHTDMHQYQRYIWHFLHSSVLAIIFCSRYCNDTEINHEMTAEHHIWIRLVVEETAEARVNCTVSCSSIKTTKAEWTRSLFV